MAAEALGTLFAGLLIPLLIIAITNAVRKKMHKKPLSGVATIIIFGVFFVLPFLSRAGQIAVVDKNGWSERAKADFLDSCLENATTSELESYCRCAQKEVVEAVKYSEVEAVSKNSAALTKILRPYAEKCL